MSKNYGEFGYFDLNIDNLGARFLFLSRHWDLPSPPGIVLRHCYETFRLSVGLGGNIFELDYDSLGKLAEHSWFKHLWHLCHLFLSPIIFNTKYKIPLMRQRDRPIMDVFCDSGIWQMEHLLVLQCMQRYRNYIFSLMLLNVMTGRLCQACWTTQKEQASGHSLKRNLERRALNCGAQRSSTLHRQSNFPWPLHTTSS